MFERQGEILPALAVIKFSRVMRIRNGPITMESYANRDHHALQRVTCGHSLDV